MFTAGSVVSIGRDWKLWLEQTLEESNNSQVNFSLFFLVRKRKMFLTTHTDPSQVEM